MCRCVDHPRAKRKGYYVFEHILVVEKHIGRYLKIGKEVVHHINGNIKDNRLKNLVVITPRKHSQLHYPEYRKNGFGFFKMHAVSGISYGSHGARTRVTQNRDNLAMRLR